jgi:serine/alanine adding enzyme
LQSPLFGRFLVSLPFFNYGGILCNERETAALLLRESNGLRGELRARYAELRHLEAGREKELATKSHKVTMILDLKGNGEEQWRALDSKVRNQVRKAEKCGLTTRLGQAELLDGFYEVFSRNMRDLGTPVYGKNFFRNILETFPHSTRILSVVKGQTPVASGLLTWFRNSLEVPWASSISDYREMCPNNLLYWEAIRFAITTGATTFDFGRSTPGEGTFRFKKQWGARPVPLYWQYQLERGTPLPELAPSNPKYRLAIRLWQQLPVAITRMLGPGIVRNIP